jgi:hypothetical protein
MTATTTELLRRPVTGRGNKLSRSEQHFYDWLEANGFEIEGWECEEFSLPGSWLRPDCKLANGIFLEHTDADKILSPAHLPQLVRQRNLAKESGRGWISPKDYLDKKSGRITLAEQLHGITILLLPATIRRQLEVMPEWLYDLIALRSSSPAGYDDFLFRQLPTLLLDQLPQPR